MENDDELARKEAARNEEPKVRNPLQPDKPDVGARAYSLGMERVRPSKVMTPEVGTLKGKTADIIDMLDQLRKQVGGKSHNESTRLFNIAMERYEEACMWAVKAATKNQ